MPGEKPRICVVGSIVMDLVVRTPRFPTPGETVLGGPFHIHPGGKGANQAIAAARMGANVAMIGCVGDDSFGDGWPDLFAAEGVDCTHVLRRKGIPTGTGTIVLKRSGQNTIVVAPGANETLMPEDVEAGREAIVQSDMLVLQMEVPTETVLHAARIAKDSGVPVLLNAAPPRELPADLATCTNLLVVNESEAAFLAGRTLATGEASLEVFARLLENLACLGVPAVFLTAGRQGALYLREQRVVAVPPFPVKTVDSVGAGDAFIGTLAVRWVEEGLDGVYGSRTSQAAEIVRWACAAGALAVTCPGAIPSLPDRGSVSALIAGGLLTFGTEAAH